jgi:hypothetical protein
MRRNKREKWCSIRDDQGQIRQKEKDILDGWEKLFPVITDR